MTDTVEELYWDPFDIEIDADPYAVWRRLRDEQPLYRNERFDFWALSRFADVEAASKAPKTFSSSHGTVLELMTDRPFGGGQMIFMDPPEHTRLRSLVSRAFTPRRVGSLEDRIRELAAGLLDAQAGRASFDYVVDFAAVLPSMVISSLLGVPDEDRARVHHMIDTMFHIEPGVGMINDTAFGARIELFEYLTDQLAQREDHPRDDMLTDLVTAEITDDDRHGAPPHRPGGGRVRGPARQRGHRDGGPPARLGCGAARPAPRPAGRRWSPTPRSSPTRSRSCCASRRPRRCRAGGPPTTSSSTAPPCRPGRRCSCSPARPGRDDRKYPDPDRFDIRRTFDHHLSFGYGVHFCLGAALARMEGRIGIEETLARFPTWQVDTDRAVRLHTSTVRGWTNVPVAV